MNIISSETRTIRKVNDELVEIVYYDHAHVTVDNLKTDIALYDKLARSKRMKRLIVIGRHTTIDMDARKKAAEENRKRKSRIIAEAIVVKSTAIRLAINMYILLLDREYPVKVFATTELANEWLRTVDN